MSIYIYITIFTFLYQDLWLHPSVYSDSQILDVLAAVACIEYLEPQNLDGDDQSLAWLRRVKKLQVPVELVCSQESLHQRGDRCRQMVTNIQWVMSYGLIHALFCILYALLRLSRYSSWKEAIFSLFVCINQYTP